MKLTHVLLCISVCAVSGCKNRTADAVALLDYGMYEATATISGMPELGQEPELVYLNVRGLSEATTTIPAASETCFGFRIDPKTIPKKCRVRLEYEHPPFRQPHHREPTIKTDEADVASKDDFDGVVVWWFDDAFEYEIVTGEWTFRAFIDNELVAEKTFTVAE